MSGEKPIPKKMADSVVAHLKQLKKQHDDNQTRTAEALGITPSAVSTALNGKRGLGLSLVVKLADEMGESVDSVLGRTTEDVVDPELAEALGRRPWPPWLRTAAMSHRGYHGVYDADQWEAWLDSLSITDTVVAQRTRGPSKQEQAFDKQREKTVAKDRKAKAK